MNLPKPNDRINNYLLEEVVGHGSFGQVWRARHHVLDQVVAIKILTDPQYVRNFRQEGVVVHGLRHPNIVRAMDIDPFADPPYMIMEYVDGPSLRAVIDNHPEGLPVVAVQSIMRGVLEGLQAAHDAGLVHRDVKPANILLRMVGNDINNVQSGDVKLTDFGLGRATGITTASLVQSGSLVTDEGKSIAGTLVYMSPEQRAGEELDGRSDLYSCAVVLYELLTGSRPAGSDLPSMDRPDIPRYLDDVFRKSYTRLQGRYDSATAMLAAITRNHRDSAIERMSPSTPAARRIGGAPVSLDARQAYGKAKCPKCSNPVEAHDNFCILCGAQVVANVPKCPSCDAFVDGHDRFCIFCGVELPQSSRA
ncbi:MAG TPA: serine/threonine-protein kinase [Phycisphaerae bacterium]|nr:serine/threonine-protein kinase [Phycisphaerae bacterium]